MPKVRVYELARELDLPNKEILDKLTQAGIIVRSHSSSVDEEEARAALQAAVAKKPKASVPAAPKEAAKPIPAPEPEKKARPAKGKAALETSQKTRGKEETVSAGVGPLPSTVEELPKKEAPQKRSVAGHLRPNL